MLNVFNYISREADRGEMYIGHGRLCVYLYVLRRILTLLYRPGCTLGGCPLAVHYWADLQLRYGFRCYDNIHMLIALHTASACSAETEMSASTCTCSMADCSIVANKFVRLILLAALIMPSVQFSVFI